LTVNQESGDRPLSLHRCKPVDKRLAILGLDVRMTALVDQDHAIRVEQPLVALGLLPLRLEAVTFEAGGKRLIKEITRTFDAGPVSIVIGPNGAGADVVVCR
jgi:hypothetical protein